MSEMKQVGIIKSGIITVGETIVDSEGRYWWRHKAEADPSCQHLRNGPFKSQTEAEEHYHQTMLPSGKSHIQGESDETRRDAQASVQQSLRVLLL